MRLPGGDECMALKRQSRRPRRFTAPVAPVRGKPEAGVQNACRDYALLRGALVLRINVAAMRVGPEGRYVRSVRWWARGISGEQSAGVSDLLILWRGLTFMVECKAPDGRNTPSDQQWLFLSAAEAAGAIVVVAYSVNDLVTAFQMAER